MNILECIVADDEPNAGKLLEEYIERVPYLHCKAQCFNAMEVMNQLKQAPADLLFLDINMPGLSGMELVKILPRRQKVILTTAYSEHALESYEYNVIDYLLKPIPYLRFLMAVEKAYQLTDTGNTNALLPGAEPDEIRNNDLFIKSDKQIIRISLHEIIYFEALREYIALHTATQKILMYRRMKDLLRRLPAYFIRIHNSYIVNTRLIEKIEGTQILIKGIHLPVGISYKERFQQFLNDRVL
jgi:DNA-binding LytR/AlgR family response regulator